MAKQCVYCESLQNLNTSLSVILEDGSKITVDICDEHADDASVKSAKQAYIAKQDKIKEVMALAAKLGLSVTQTGGIAVAQKMEPAETEPAETAASPPPLPSQPSLDSSSPDVISTARIDHNRGMASVGGSTNFGAVESHQHINTDGLEDKLSDDVMDGMVEMNLVEGREGQPLAIQKKRVDGTGTTLYHIQKAETDQRLQSRFKSMAKDSLEGKTPDFARSGYANATINCPMCHSAGSVKQRSGTIVCPKCNGSGIISTY